MKYEIKGGAMPIVEIHVDKNESIKCEGGGMIWMSDNMSMETKGGGLGKMFGRALSGESMFQNIYTAKGGEGMITLGSCFPGSIIAVEIGPGKELICQKSAYLGSSTGVELSIEFQKKFGTGVFGGEGFIMQRLSGKGLAFVEIDGTAIEYTLAAGEKMIIDTGHLAFMEGSCKMDIEKVKGGIKNMAFGGEGLFNTAVTGPGKITLQTMPKNAMAAQIAPYMVTGGN